MLSIPPNAPFTPEQVGWLNGYLAARIQVQGGGPSTAPTASETSTTGLPITILWGSQTGNSESLAKRAAKSLGSKGHQVTVTDMAQVEPQSLPKIENLFIITSTYGDGEPPDNAAVLHEYLQSDKAASFENTNYTVLGLGDSEYPDFNQCAKDFDTALEKRGAKRITPLIESDVDYDEPFDQWLADITESLSALA